MFHYLFNLFKDIRNYKSALRTCLLAIIMILHLICTNILFAQQNPASLDSTFDGDGKVLTDL